MSKKIIIAMIAIFVIAGAAGFYGGMLYGQNNRAGFNANANIMMQRGSGMQQGGVAGGEIIKKDDNSLTIKLNNGSSQIILFSGTTKVMKSADGSAADLVVGGQVTITGSKNQDGSITAQSIQIRPRFQ